jgi:predicted membrane-bound mannosyltransferase
MGRRFRPRLGWEAALFLAIALAALGLRLWELDGRTMHYDESLHVHYAWRLANGEGYSHSPWMHGPFQVELTAIIFKLFSDSDFTARLGYALFGSLLVGLPYFFRSHLGRTGAVVTSVLLALSPSLLYFSRFGRNEVLISVWALALLILMWRYIHERKDRYLYMFAAVLALMLATKETAYIVVALFTAALFLISLPEVLSWLLGRTRLREMSGAPTLLILMVTLTLPQWSALASLFQDSMGAVIANAEGGAGEVGLPVWGPPFAIFPLAGLSAFGDALVLAALVILPAVSLCTGIGRRWARLLVPAGFLGALVYALVAFPGGFVARNYLIAFGVLAATFLVSVAIGLTWRWKLWLPCAGVFYLLWTSLYTSGFGAFVQSHGYCPSEVGGFFHATCAKLGGVFTGSWQGLGYWLAQQDVARGSQPWYYHFILGSLYEFLPLAFGAVAIIYFLRKADILGLFLGFWAILTFLAYTIAGEKMPWLVVNMALPFILLAGKFIGELIDRVPWRRLLATPGAAMLALAPLLLGACVYLLYRGLDEGGVESWQSWGLVVAIVLMAGVSALLIHRSRPRVATTLGGLGICALLLGFSSFVAFRANYSYDDTPIEMLVYAQGSADLVKVVKTLDEGVIREGRSPRSVEVDYEMWYPMNWYLRHEQRAGTVEFRCYKDDKEDGYVSWCNPLSEPPATRALLLVQSHADRDRSFLEGHERSGPFKDLLWFPEGYRRPGEDRRAESVARELKEDFGFIKDRAASREAWKDALDYFLFRRLDAEWWDSRFYSYISTAEAQSG